MCDNCDAVAARVQAKFPSLSLELVGALMDAFSEEYRATDEAEEQFAEELKVLSEEQGIFVPQDAHILITVTQKDPEGVNYGCDLRWTGMGSHEVDYFLKATLDARVSGLPDGFTQAGPLMLPKED